MLRTLLFIYLSILANTSYSQSFRQFFLYSYNRSLFNPAEVGSEGKHEIVLNGNYFTTGREKNGVVNYHGPIESLHGGIGLLAMVSNSSYAKFSRIGVSYNYRFDFDENTSIRIGARPTLNRYQDVSRDHYYSTEKDIYPNLDFGGYLTYNSFYLGSWFTNAFYVPYATTGTISSVNIIAGRKMHLTNSVQTDPSIAFSFNSVNNFLILNNNLLIKKLVIVGSTLALDIDPEGNSLGEVAINAGINLFNRIDLIGVLWSSRFKDIVDVNPVYFEGVIKLKL